MSSSPCSAERPHQFPPCSRSVRRSRAASTASDLCQQRRARSRCTRRCSRSCAASVFVEGQNLTVLSGGFGVRNELLGEVAAALVRAEPNAIIAAGSIATRAAQAATKTIPILASSDNMVEDGLVPSIRRPGGNTTGVSLLAQELDGKRQDLIMEAIPGIRRIGALSDPHVSTPQHLEDLKEAARRRDAELLVFSVSTSEGIAPAMSEASVAGVQALNVLATPLFFFNRQIVLARAAALRLPAIYQWPEMAEEAASRVTGRASRSGSVSWHGCSPRCCGAPIPARFRSSSRIDSNWLSI